MTIYKRRKPEPFSIRTGLKQGDILSPLLFSLVLERVIRKVKEQSITEEQAKILGYADDIGLVRETMKEVINTCIQLTDVALKVDLTIH